MRYLKLIAAAAAIAGASLADAAHARSWTGFFLGGNLGGASAEIDWGAISLTNETGSFSSSGFVGGGQFGYNHQFSRLIIGAEVTISAADIREEVRSSVNPAVTYASRHDWYGTAGVRAGFVPAPALMIYGKVGVGFGGVAVSGRDTVLLGSFSESSTESGLMLGAGLEFALYRRLSLGLDYTFIGFGSTSVSGTTTAGIAYTLSDVEVDLHALTGRLNYRF